MTFTEAAVEVLRLVGKPLHYKKITEIAIERNLLSHVGKTPETTMASRLAMLVKKDRGDAPIIKLKAGVFALREFPEEVLANVDEDAEIEIPELPPEPKEEEVDEEARRALKSEHRPPGSEVFPEEEDDDEPILANLDESADEETNNRKKRRRRGGRRGKGETEDAPSEIESRRAESRRGRERSERSERRDERGRSGTRRQPEELTGDWNRAPERGDASGTELIEAIRDILERGPKRSRRARAVAEDLVRRRRLVGTGEALAPTVAAAVRADISRRKSSGGRARFRIEDDAISLVDWELPNDAVRAERDAARFAARQRDAIRRDFLRTLSDLPTSGLMELLASWLNAMGVTALRGVKREGRMAGVYHLAGILHRGPVAIPLAIVVVRNSPITRDLILDVRGGIHHYGDARIAWIVSLKGSQPDARREASGSHLIPVALFEGKDLTKAMERAGVGLKSFHLPMLVPDFSLLESLRGPGYSSMPELHDEEPLDSSNEREEEDSEETDTTSVRGRRRRRGARHAAADESGEHSVALADADDEDASGESAASDEEPEDDSEDNAGSARSRRRGRRRRSSREARRMAAESEHDESTEDESAEDAPFEADADREASEIEPDLEEDVDEEDVEAI
ncbi:MAG: hypothetical protein GX614_12175, partial [Sandaracinaceae bacterium]|nr:hypothetical protein [Sandaracinaceae bacterium]